MRRVDAKFGDAITLVGYLLEPTGNTLNISLYWQSIAKIEKDYTVFVHLVDSNGNIRAQRDAQPRAGVYPTSIWDIGEVIRDDYSFALGALPTGEYQIRLGMYEYPTLGRLTVKDTTGKFLGDNLILPESVEVSR
jgi:hypothetical protein